MRKLRIFTNSHSKYHFYPIVKHKWIGKNEGQVIAERCLGSNYDEVEEHIFEIYDYNDPNLINLINKDDSDIFFFCDYCIGSQISKEILFELNKKLDSNINVFFCCHYEPYTVLAFEHLNKYLYLDKREQIPLWMICNNAVVFSDIRKPKNLNVAYIEFYSGYQLFGLREYVNEFDLPTQTDENQVEQRDFLCLNFKRRPARKYFIDLLRKNNLYEKGYVSYGGSTIDNVIDKNSDGFGSSNVLLPSFYDITPWTKKVYFEVIVDFVNYSFGKVEDENFIALSEKFFRSVYNKTPFLLYSKPNTLKYIKALGYKTYEGLFDEAYDNIRDWRLRGRSIVSEMKNFCNKTLDQKLEWFEKAKEIAEYNYQHLTNSDNVSNIYLEQFKV